MTRAPTFVGPTICQAPTWAAGTAAACANARRTWPIGDALGGGVLRVEVVGAPLRTLLGLPFPNGEITEERLRDTALSGGPRCRMADGMHPVRGAGLADPGLPGDDEHRHQDRNQESSHHAPPVLGGPLGGAWPTSPA